MSNMVPNKPRRGREALSLWDEDAAKRYAAAKHGPDGFKFLDPHLIRLLSRDRLAGTDFVDLGAGAGPWSLHALEQGAKTVTLLDLNPAMLEQARVRLQINGVLPENVSIHVGDVSALDFSDNAFETLTSINVGCNLPAQKFGSHFTEAFRIARPGARFLVTAPDSLLVPFTNSEEAIDIQKEIDSRWNFETSHDAVAAKRVIGSLPSVLRATFILDQSGKPILVTEENQSLVIKGTPIFRRIPGLAVENNVHTAEEYIQEAERAGWIIDEVYQDSFASEQDRIAYNSTVPEAQRLGPEYVKQPAFMVMDLQKA